MTAKDRALAIAAQLAAVEQENPNSLIVKELHTLLLLGLQEQAAALGFDEADVSEIEGEVAARGGGGNKSGA